MKKHDLALYNKITTPVNVEKFFRGKYTFNDILWQSFSENRIRLIDQLHPVAQIIDTEPRGCRQVVKVKSFYVLWVQRQSDGSRWVTLEPKTSFLPSGVHSVKKYYASKGIKYGNSWLSLNEPGDLDDFYNFPPTEVDELVASVARRTAETTVSADVTNELLSDMALEGDELLSDEGQNDPDCFEDDCDDRADTTELEMLRDLKKICFQVHKLKSMSKASRPKWPSALKLERKKFDVKYFSLSINAYKYFQEQHGSSFVFN